MKIKLTTSLQSYTFDPNPQYPPDSTHNDTPANNTRTDRKSGALTAPFANLIPDDLRFRERCCGDASIGSLLMSARTCARE